MRAPTYGDSTPIHALGTLIGVKQIYKSDNRVLLAKLPQNDIKITSIRLTGKKIRGFKQIRLYPEKITKFGKSYILTGRFATRPETEAWHDLTKLCPARKIEGLGVLLTLGLEALGLAWRWPEGGWATGPRALARPTDGKAAQARDAGSLPRSEERRVGKEC